MPPHHPVPASPDDSHRLPATQGGRGSHGLTLARNQQISTEVGGGDGGGGDEIDLLAYWRILVKRRWTVLATLAIIIAAALVATLLTTPIYRASASLQIDRDTIQVVDVGGMTPMEGAGDRDFYQTQYELLQSRALAQRVVAQLGLAESGELQRMSPPSPWLRLLALVSGGSDDAEAVAAPSDLDADLQQQRLVRQFSQGLSIEPVRNSRLVRVHYDSPDPAFSQRAANAVAEAFIASNLERRFDSSSYAKGYLEDRLQELKLRLEDSERQLVAFAQQEQIVSTGEQSSSLSDQTLTALNAALAQARQDRFRAESRWRQAQASDNVLMHGAAGENSIIATLQENRARLRAEYQDNLRLYKPAFPSMQQLQAQIEEVEQQIDEELAGIKRSVQAEYLAALEQERLLTEQFAETKTQALDLQNRSIQYNIYKREVDTNRQIYDGLLQRYKEIGVAGGVSTNNISVVDRAEPGGKFKPSMARNLALGALLGLVLGVLLALAFEFLDDTLKAPEDVERHLGLAMLGVIPKLKAPQTPAKAMQDPRSAFCEAYRSMCTALQFSTDRGAPRCLLVTSATPAEGKSTTAMVLAQNLANLGKTVLLIDCDLRNPSLHKQLRVKSRSGLTNYLSGSSKPLDVIAKTHLDNLMLIPAGPLPPNPAELLTGPRMLTLLTMAEQRYDHVVLDGPPVMGLADALILSNMAKGTLLVVEAGETRIAVARNAVKRLLSARGHLVGALMTKYEARLGSYGYGYGDYNYYAYGGKAAVKKLGRR